MLAEQRNPAIRNFFDKMESKVGMIKPIVNLQNLRRRIYAKLKVEDSAGKGGVTIGESISGAIGHIKLGKKRIGKRSARNSHATFEEAGAGNGLTAPALDPTPFGNKLGL